MAEAEEVLADVDVDRLVVRVEKLLVDDPVDAAEPLDTADVGPVLCEETMTGLLLVAAEEAVEAGLPGLAVVLTSPNTDRPPPPWLGVDAV